MLLHVSIIFYVINFFIELFMHLYIVNELEHLFHLFNFKKKTVNRRKYLFSFALSIKFYSCCRPIKFFFIVIYYLTVIQIIFKTWRQAFKKFILVDVVCFALKYIVCPNRVFNLCERTLFICCWNNNNYKYFL